MSNNTTSTSSSLVSSPTLFANIPDNPCGNGTYLAGASNMTNPICLPDPKPTATNTGILVGVCVTLGVIFILIPVTFAVRWYRFERAQKHILSDLELSSMPTLSKFSRWPSNPFKPAPPPPVGILNTSEKGSEAFREMESDGSQLQRTSSGSTVSSEGSARSVRFGGVTKVYPTPTTPMSPGSPATEGSPVSAASDEPMLPAPAYTR